MLESLDSLGNFVECVRRAENHSSDATKIGNYKLHYPAILHWFALQRGQWTGEAVLQGCLMVYGWMPTIFEGRKTKGFLTKEYLEDIANMLNRDFQEWKVENSNFCNGSVVGTSKFLHFWEPDKFAIWDSNVYRALLTDNWMRKIYRHEVEQFDLCQEYQSRMRAYCDKFHCNMRYVESKLFAFGRFYRPSKSD